MKNKLLKCILFLPILLIIMSCSDSDSDNKENPGGTPEPPVVEDVIPDKDGITVNGKVLCEGNPVANVVVSDGYNVTKTDDMGIYYLRTDFQKSGFVFISLPSGYELDSKNPFPEFYEPLSYTGKTIRKDFKLTRVDNTKYVLIAAADMHISGVKRPKASAIDTVLFKDGFLADLDELKKSYPAGTKFYGVNIGDMVWEEYREKNNVWYPEYKNVMRNVDFPVFHAIGNHDYDDRYENDDKASEGEYNTYLGPTYYSFNIGNIHYVMLDNIVYKNEAMNRDFDVRLSQNQLDWLYKDLLAMPSTIQNVFVCLHCPSSRRNPIAGAGMANKDALYSLLRGYNVRILSGHNHITENVKISDQMREHTLPSVCGASWYVSTCIDGSPAGYGVFEIDGNNIVKYNKSIGHPKDYQYRVYNRGITNDDGKPSVLVNVFDWDEDWTVQCYENNSLITNGGRVIPVKGSTDYRADPLYQSYYDGGYLTSHSAYVPYATDHLFIFTPSNSDSTLRIVVKNAKTNYSDETVITLE